MRPDLSKWEQTSRYDYLDDLPMNGLAWECLRRNRDYQDEYRETLHAATDDRRNRLRDHWGLQFRGAAEPIRMRRAGALVGQDRYRLRRPYHLAGLSA